MTGEQQAWLAENFADTSNAECARHLNVGWRTVVRMARNLGLEKSREFLEYHWRENVEKMRIMNKGEGNRGKENLIKYGAKYRFKKGETSRQRIGDVREEQRIRKMAETRRETVRKERARIIWGYPQKTKMKLVSNRRQTLMRYAMKKRGYIVERGAIDVYYKDQTQRSPLLENRAREIGIRVFNSQKI